MYRVDAPVAINNSVAFKFSWDYMATNIATDPYDDRPILYTAHSLDQFGVFIEKVAPSALVAEERPAPRRHSVKRHLRSNAHPHVNRAGIVAVESNLYAFIVEPGVWDGADADIPVNCDSCWGNF